MGRHASRLGMARGELGRRAEGPVPPGRARPGGFGSAPGGAAAAAPTTAPTRTPATTTALARGGRLARLVLWRVLHQQSVEIQGVGQKEIPGGK